MRDLGTAGEKFFGTLCATAAGMAANKSETDINGWDLFVEIDNVPSKFDRMSMHEGLIETKIQVKSTDGNKKFVDVELSNLKKMATSSLPCFYVLLEFDSGDIPVRGYLRHFDDDLIEKTLRRVSDEYVKDPNVKLNKKKMRLSFHEPIVPLAASVLKQLTMNHIGASHFDYLDRKREHLKSVGFEEGAHRIQFSFTGDDKLHKLIDISLGKRGAVQVVNVHGASLRFGVLSDRHKLTDDTALLTMPDVIPSDHGFLTFRDKSTGRTLKFPVDLYTSPFNAWIPKPYQKIRMDAKLFEFNILNQGKTFNLSMNVDLLERFEVEEALRMFKLMHMFSNPKNVEIVFDFQDLSSTAYLKSGDGFPDQSKKIEILEGIVKIKRYFEVDTPLNFSDHELERINTKPNFIIKLIDGNPEIFTLKFPTIDDIALGTEIESFYIFSFQLEKYVFIELILFLGNVELEDDGQYSITPRVRRSFYKTMFLIDSFNKESLMGEITSLIEGYESELPVINFSPAFFESLKI
ncbi:hypothetical protein [Pseudomonas sp. CFBP 5748]